MLSYRRELDGLRALAVIAVIIYHAKLEVFGLQIFKGGFFGVDVFFVLSGYLITAIIRNDMSKGSFSFVNFYWRRAKRIVPALVTMLAVTSVIAYFLLLPSDLIAYAESLKSALYFGSNYYFYSEDSYVADASIYKPLLHTWSLAVEWQFYIIYPVIVWLVNRFFKQYLFEALLALALLSLQFSSFIVGNYPDMAFYLLPSRAWELIFGGLVTFYNRDRLSVVEEGSLEKFCYKALPLLGIFLIVHSMLFVDHDVKHPSFLTLLPVLGTCLFLMFSHKNEASSDLLSTKPFVYIGLASYSLYLWHQPVFVFFRFIKHDYFRYEQFLLLLVISMVLSFISYRFVEYTFRKKNISSYSVFIITILSLGMLFFSNQAKETSGFVSRLGNIENLFSNLRDSVSFYIAGESKSCHHRGVDTACKLIGEGSNGNILLVGDSHAGVLGLHTFNYTQSNKMTFTDFSISACNSLDERLLKPGQYAEKICRENIPKIAKYLEDEASPRFKIIYSTSIAYLNENQLNKRIEAYKKLSYWRDLGHEIVLIYPSPRYEISVPKEINKKLTRYLPTMREYAYKSIKITKPYSEHIERSKFAHLALDSVKGDNITRIYPEKVFCSDQYNCKANDSEHIYYYDSHHLSPHGSKLLVNEMFKKLMEDSIF